RLLRSTTGDLEIQGRQERFGNSESMSVNSAVAARDNGHRVGIYQVDRRFVVRVDGAETTEPTVDLGGGAGIIVRPGGIEVTFPDGTPLWSLDPHGYGDKASV